MTVTSLWKALDRAGCGKRVGAKELQDHHRLNAKKNPWNFHEMEKLCRSPESQPVLAVDLSIWICEALTSSAMQKNHVVDPAVQLVYSRTLNLLNLGIKLVIVIEGKRRIRGQRGTNNPNDANTEVVVGEDKFRKRRSGARFWTACQRCEELLRLLGVIVVRAKAEGEALCALLNQKGIVDGVISNDGDCFLFGAKVLYTKFSIENLHNSNVIRYDANDIRAVVDDDDSNRYDETGHKSKEGQDIVELSRNDLITFAILTGSDLAGDGIAKVGCRKAIRFIRKCQIDNPLKIQNNNSPPAMNLLLSWEQAAMVSSTSIDDPLRNTASGPHCSCCGHLGTKKSHKKNGCEGCGTKPGEPCFQLSPGGRFRKLLRTKALEMQSSFNPSSTIRAYREPNENEVPLFLVGKTARTIQMGSPQIEKVLDLPLIVSGRNLHESRAFLRKSVMTYLARREVLGQMISKSSPEEDKLTKLPKNPNRPVPKSISKLLVRGRKPSCEVNWIVKATTSDAEGNSMDEYEFTTIEDECAIKKCYPKLFEIFQEEQMRIQRQGAAEQEKRQAFLLCMTESKDRIPIHGKKNSQTRRDSFEGHCRASLPITKQVVVSDDIMNIVADMKKTKRPRQKSTNRGKGDSLIGQFVAFSATGNIREVLPTQRACRGVEGDPGAVYEMNSDSSTIQTGELTGYNISDQETPALRSKDDYVHSVLTPGDKHFLGTRAASGIPSMIERTRVSNIGTMGKGISLATDQKDSENTIPTRRSSRNEILQPVCQSLQLRAMENCAYNGMNVSRREGDLFELRPASRHKNADAKEDEREEGCFALNKHRKRSQSRSPDLKRFKKEGTVRICQVDDKLKVSTRSMFASSNHINSVDINDGWDDVENLSKERLHGENLPRYDEDELRPRSIYKERNEGIRKRLSVSFDDVQSCSFDERRDEVGDHHNEKNYSDKRRIDPSTHDLHCMYDNVCLMYEHFCDNLRRNQNGDGMHYHKADDHCENIGTKHDNREIGANDYQDEHCHRIRRFEGERKVLLEHNLDLYDERIGTKCRNREIGWNNEQKEKLHRLDNLGNENTVNGNNVFDENEKVSKICYLNDQIEILEREQRDLENRRNRLALFPRLSMNNNKYMSRRAENNYVCRKRSFRDIEVDRKPVRDNVTIPPAPRENHNERRGEPFEILDADDDFGYTKLEDGDFLSCNLFDERFDFQDGSDSVHSYDEIGAIEVRESNDYHAGRREKLLRSNHENAWPSYEDCICKREDRHERTLSSYDVSTLKNDTGEFEECLQMRLESRYRRAGVGHLWSQCLQEEIECY